jgi:hypothetical protein
VQARRSVLLYDLSQRPALRVEQTSRLVQGPFLGRAVGCDDIAGDLEGLPRNASESWTLVIAWFRNFSMRSANDL